MKKLSLIHDFIMIMVLCFALVPMAKATPGNWQTIAADLGVAGAPLAEPEALAIVDQLNARIYSMNEALESLKLEFEPEYIDMREAARRRSARYHITLPASFRCGLFAGGPHAMSYDSLQPLAAKAAFYWKRPERPKQRLDELKRHLAVVEMFDRTGQRLAIHPFQGVSLGWAFAETFALLDKQTFLQPRDPAGKKDTWEKLWLLEKRADRSVLKLLYRPREGGNQDSWMMLEYHYLPQGMSPLAILHKGRDSRRGWYESSASQYTRLGNTDRYAISRAGVTFPTIFEWTQVGGQWVISQASGIREAYEQREYTNRTGPREIKKVPWTIRFSKIEVNPVIPNALLAWPERNPVKMDFSSPDTAAQTVFNCLQSDRLDLLPYCTMNPPKDSPPTQSRYSDLSYWFDVDKGVKESLKLTEKKQQGEDWNYRVQMSYPFGMQTRGGGWVIERKGQEWRMTTEPSALIFYFIYD